MDPGEALCCPQIERYGSAMALLTVPRSFAAALAAARQSPKSAGAVRRKQFAIIANVLIGKLRVK